ncbi:NUDIX hydrolase [Roseobacter sp. HKCCA0434]|uniref:NUDIX hydrolase n=1 Tax=Roseobacter sp. HKCCA0434 TaxID=3079297 RepID=UPI002905C8E1|nr:NUDIX domain-containing protein [Roseobacter sp. HKCCA0434]
MSGGPVWRPAPAIRFKALGLHWRQGRLLAVEVLDDAGKVKGVRPLGGGVEFGETARDAVIREFREELGIVVTVGGSPVFMENIFRHEGSIGHEVIALFDVTFPEGAFDGQTRLSFREEGGTVCFAEWFDPDGLDRPERPRLYPEGLKDLLR